MTKTIELMKIDGRRSLILWLDGETKKFVVCSYYNPAMEVGQQWCWGHYFKDLKSAMAYINDSVGIMPETRKNEIMEQAISYLADNDLLDDFLEDRDIELSDEEKEYFCIGKEDEDYED